MTKPKLKRLYLPDEPIPQPEVWFKCRYPVRDATQIAITAGFGQDRIYQRGVIEPHEGIDFRTEIPEARGPVRAVITPMLKGIVSRVANQGNRGYGLYVVVTSELTAPDGSKQVWDHYYAHLSRVFTQTGYHVNPGDPIGLSGSTGNSTGEHCHVTLRLRGFKNLCIVEGAADFAHALFIPHQEQQQP